MAYIDGKDLEDLGKTTLAKVGINCVHPLKQTRYIDIDPTGSYSENDHFEFDYFVPMGDTCLVGEMKGTATAHTLRNEYQNFKKHFDWLKNQNLTNAAWKILGVPEDQVRQFRNVSNLRGFS